MKGSLEHKKEVCAWGLFNLSVSEQSEQSSLRTMRDQLFLQHNVELL